MTRDFSKDLTIMVTGSGAATMQHLQESLAEWIFGPVEEREVHVILPVLANMGGAVRNIIKLGNEWEFKFTVIQAKDAPMTRELSAVPEDCFIREDDERAALERGLSLLTERMKAGDEAAFLMAYNPASTYEQGNLTLSDFEIIGDAKNYNWLPTLNICEGLIDSFEGYKTTDEILKEQRLKEEFEDKQRAEEAAKPEKKAPAPRKRAAKKTVAPEPKPLPVEPEKPLEESPEPTCACNGETNLEVHTLEGCYDVPKHNGPNPFRAPLPTGNELSATVAVDLTPKPDVWSEVDKAHAQVDRNTIAVSKIDLAQLSMDIKELTTAFGNIMDTFTRILKDG